MVHKCDIFGSKKSWYLFFFSLSMPKTSKLYLQTMSSYTQTQSDHARTFQCKEMGAFIKAFYEKKIH